MLVCLGVAVFVWGWVCVGVCVGVFVWLIVVVGFFCYLITFSFIFQNAANSGKIDVFFCYSVLLCQEN